MRRDWLGLSFGLLIALAVLGAPARAQVGFDRPGGDYASFPHALRRSRPMRRPLRARSALPRLGLLLSRDRKRQRRLLAQVPGHAAGRSDLLRVRRARDRRHRAAQRDRSSSASIASAATTGSSRFRPIPNGKSCQLACEGEEGCRAWTYVRPGYVGTSAVCYLKNHITRPVRKPCCISGVVR